MQWQTPLNRAEACRRTKNSSSSPPHSAPSSNGTTSTFTRRWRHSSRRCSFPPATTRRRCFPPSPPTRQASWSARSAPLVFGRIGDLVGRKYTFLVTIVVMGFSTFLVGVLPTFAAHRLARRRSCWSLRLLQGLALGGEYGGAATYVAEHAPAGRRGYCHELDPDHRHARLLPLARDHRLCRGDMSASDFRRVGLAHSVPALGRPAGVLGLHPAQAE